MSPEQAFRPLLRAALAVLACAALAWSQMDLPDLIDLAPARPAAGKTARPAVPVLDPVLGPVVETAPDPALPAPEPSLPTLGPRPAQPVQDPAEPVFGPALPPAAPGPGPAAGAEPPAPRASPTILPDLETTLRNLSGLDRLERQSLISVVQVLQKRHDQAYLSLKGLPQDEPREAWLDLWELYLADKLGLEDEARRLAGLLKPRYWEQKLEIPRLEFCTSVKGFGRYEPLPSASLEGGKNVLVYVELTGLAQKQEGAWFVSGGTYSFEVLDEAGAVAFRQKEPQRFSDRARSPLADYYLWLEWKPSLPPGKYRMSFRVKNDAAGQGAGLAKAFSVF